MYLPSPLFNVGKYGIFSNKKRKNHLIINIESGGRGELAWCLNSFVWDCLKEEFYKECHTTHSTKGWRREELKCLVGTANEHC